MGAWSGTTAWACILIMSFEYEVREAGTAGISSNKKGVLTHDRTGFG